MTILTRTSFDEKELENSLGINKNIKTIYSDDVYLAWRLMEYVAGMVNIKPGYLYHTIDSLHAYKKDWWMLKTSIDDIK